MKHIIKFLALAIITAALSGCRGGGNRSAIIFDTDFGNDVDDALAADMLFKYADEGKIDLLAIMTSKKGDIPAGYARMLCNWYGHPEVAVAQVEDGADSEDPNVTNYAEKVCSMTSEDGSALFAEVEEPDNALPAHILYRKILSGAKNHSIDIVCTGFSTNLAKLLDTPADRWSHFDGKKLVAKKVRCLYMMAGNFTEGAGPEFNVVKDIPAARKVLEQWPGEIIISPFDVGQSILYPGECATDDFAWQHGEPHPVLESYRCYLPMPYDRPTWDLTSVLCAVEGTKWFSLSVKGNVSVDDSGRTSFTPDDKGSRRYMMVDSTGAAKTLAHFEKIISEEPLRHGTGTEQ